MPILAGVLTHAETSTIPYGQGVHLKLVLMTDFSEIQ